MLSVIMIYVKFAPQGVAVFDVLNMEPMTRFELVTYGLRNRCSTS